MLTIAHNKTLRALGKDMEDAAKRAVKHEDPHSTNLAKTGIVDRIWIRLAANLEKTLRTKTRARSAEGAAKGLLVGERILDNPHTKAPFGQ